MKKGVLAISLLTIGFWGNAGYSANLSKEEDRRSLMTIMAMHNWLSHWEANLVIIELKLDLIKRTKPFPFKGLGIAVQGGVSNVWKTDKKRFMVVRVLPKSPAEQAGIEFQDLIVSINGNPVVGDEEEFLNLFENNLNKDVIQLGIQRIRVKPEQDITFTVTLKSSLVGENLSQLVSIKYKSWKQDIKLCREEIVKIEKELKQAIQKENAEKLNDGYFQKKLESLSKKITWSTTKELYELMVFYERIHF